MGLSERRVSAFVLVYMLDHLGIAGCCNCRSVAAIAEDPAFHLKLRFEPGDIEWLHNPSTFHARTAVVDGEVMMDL